MCSTMSSTSLTIEQRLDRLYARSQANGSTTSPDPHSGILDWRPSSMTKPAAKTSSSPPPPLLKKARHRPRSEDSVPKVDEAAIAKLKRVDDDQVSKIFAEMNDIGGGAALSPVVRHSGCARLREFVPSLQKTSFEQAQEIAASSRRRLDDHDSDSSGLEETDDDDDKTPQARSVGGAVCALLPEERPVKTSPSAASSPLLRKASTVPMDITADDDDASRLSGRVQITAQERRSSSERGRRQRSRSPARSRKSSPPDRRKGEADLPPAPPRLRVSAEAKVACSPSASVAPVSASSPSLGSSMESPTVGQSNQTVLVQQSVKWKDAVKLKRLADKMKKEAPLSEGWCKRQEMYMSAGLKFLEAAEMYSCAHSYQNTAQYFENIIQMYLSAGCHFFTCIGYECSAVALYRAMQVRRKDFSIQVNQLLAHVRAHQSKNTAAAATDSAPEPLSFPSKLGDMLSSYLRHSKCAWDYMDDWDKAKAYRPSREVLDAHRLEVLESLDNLDMAKFIDHVRRALSSSFTS